MFEWIFLRTQNIKKSYTSVLVQSHLVQTLKVPFGELTGRIAEIWYRSLKSKVHTKRWEVSSLFPRKGSFSSIANMKFINIFALCKNMLEKIITLLLLNMVKDYDQNWRKESVEKGKEGSHLRFDCLISEKTQLPKFKAQILNLSSLICWCAR